MARTIRPIRIRFSKRPVVNLFIGLILTLLLYYSSAQLDPRSPASESNYSVTPKVTITTSPLVKESPSADLTSHSAATPIVTAPPESDPGENDDVDPDQTTYPVVRVIDGDTLVIAMGNKTETVRLIGIDTPELSDKRQEVKCFAHKAGDRLRELTLNQSVQITADSTQTDRDKYSRLLRYITLPDGTLVNLLLIKEGLANEYTYRYPYLYQKEFRQAQLEARQNNVGLWSPNSCQA